MPMVGGQSSAVGSQSSVRIWLVKDLPLACEIAMSKFTRRTFLRVMALAATTSVAAACDMAAPQAGQPTPAPATSAPAAPPTSAATAVPVRLELAGGDADVWGWQRQVS